MSRFRACTCALVLAAALPAAPFAGEIHDAAEEGDLDVIRSLLARDPAALEAVNESGYTALHRAAYNDHAAVVDYLLGQGADVNATTPSGSTPLHGAAYHGCGEAAQVLIARGADLQRANRGGFTPLLGACAGGRIELVRLLLTHGADVHARGSGGRTSLIYAVDSRNEELVRLLIEQGVDVNAEGAGHETALYRALWHNEIPIAALLLEKGADVDARTNDGTPLAYFAVAYRDPAIAGLCLARASDIGYANELHLTMLHYAAARGMEQPVRTLLDRGADVNARCITGRTPLDFAVLWGHDAVGRLLSARGSHETWKTGRPTGPYLGSPEPGRFPQVFATHEFMTPFTPHGGITFAPNGREIIWTHMAMPVMGMWSMRQEGERWMRPELVPFMDPALEYFDGGPCFTPEGGGLLFHSRRPRESDGERREDADIWYVERTARGWGVPLPRMATDHEEYDPSIAGNGNLYFIGEGYPDVIGAGDIYVAEARGDGFGPPRNLGAIVNSEYHELSPAIAPDESYILFSSNRPAMGRRALRLKVSFRRADGSWTHPTDLGQQVNTGHTWHPEITPDNRFIIYQRADEYHWFSARYIEDLKVAVLGPEARVELGVRQPRFRRSDQRFEGTHTHTIATGDLDADGDIDIVCANMGETDSRVWLNDGNGRLVATDQALSQQGHGTDVGDVDGDGDLDILLACAGMGRDSGESHRPSKIYLNDGRARFRDSGQDLGDSLRSGVGAWLRDVDGDGDLDGAIAYHQDQNRIYLNDGSGRFTDSGETFPQRAAWGDINGDGAIDLIGIEPGAGYRAVLNDGRGRFRESWRLADSTVCYGKIGLCDLDEDGDLDAVITQGDNTGCHPTSVWMNDGTGRFEEADRRFPVARWGGVLSGDINGDGHVDVCITNLGLPACVLINDGTGRLVDCGLRVGGRAASSHGAMLDLDGDGDLDLYLVDFGEAGNEIWFNEP